MDAPASHGNPPPAHHAGQPWWGWSSVGSRRLPERRDTRTFAPTTFFPPVTLPFTPPGFGRSAAACLFLRSQAGSREGAGQVVVACACRPSCLSDHNNAQHARQACLRSARVRARVHALPVFFSSLLQIREESEDDLAVHLAVQLIDTFT